MSWIQPHRTNACAGIGCQYFIGDDPSSAGDDAAISGDDQQRAVGLSKVLGHQGAGAADSMRWR